jgi:hypothetical protein
MRSFILTAAIAAALIPASLTVSYAAKSGAPSSRSERSLGDAERFERALGHAERRGRAMGLRNQNGQADPVPPVEIYPQGWMSSSLLAPRTARFARIETEVGRAMHRINVDRRLGELTRHEARVARNEERAVRAEAVTIAREHQGRIPYPSYAMLQTRVSGLDRTIDREANHA